MAAEKNIIILQAKVT